MSIRVGFLRGTAILTVVPWLATAQSSPAFSRPVMGYVFDTSNKTVKVIAGIPGAAGMETAFEWGGGALSISPRNRFGLGSLNGLNLADWTTGTLASRPLSGGDENPTQVAFAPSGRTAIAFFRTSGKLRIWSGLPDAPALESERDAALPDTVDALAVADDARAAAVLSNGKLFRVEGDGSLWPLDPDATYSAIAFRPGTRDLAVADADNARILLFADLASGSASTVVAADTPNPAAVNFSADGNTLVAAAHGIASILTLDMRTRNAVRLDCACRPTGFYPVSGNAVFRLGDSAKGNLALLDGDGDTPRIVLVSAPEGGAQ